MQNEQEEVIAKRWKLEAEERTRMVTIEKGNGWTVEEKLEDLMPRRKRIAAPETEETNKKRKVKE